MPPDFGSIPQYSTYAEKCKGLFQAVSLQGRGSFLHKIPPSLDEFFSLTFLGPIVIIKTVWIQCFEVFLWTKPFIIS